MKAAVVALVLVLVTVGGFFGYYFFRGGASNDNFARREVTGAKPLEKYAIENLGKGHYQSSEIGLGEVLGSGEEFISRVFYFYVDGKRISGQLNYPKGEGIYPVIVMSRGYIEREGYKTGDGTRRSSEEFVKAGFVTIAPDFLGYGESDMPSELPLEERFQTYTTLLTLIGSVDRINVSFEKNAIGARISPNKIGLWGHSNGGQITLTVLAASAAPYPTVLWAPVTKPFPYSILFYTDDFEDHGKMLRRAVAEFERDYDAEMYSLTNYLGKINAPMSLHQGAQDEEVPIGWSNEFVLELRKLKKDIDYHTYPEDDHNFTNGSWKTVVSRNIEFFRNNL